MKLKLLPYLVIISALSVSLSAAFYSVTGIAKMFSGSSLQVMIMMGSLEIAKLVLASLLYQYWDKINILLKAYYSIAILVLMIITSAGIYGYLSSAYSETSNKVENIDKQVSVLDIKRGMFENQLVDTRKEKAALNENIANLTKGVSNNVIQYKDKTGQLITTTSSANRKVYEDQLKSSQKSRDDLALKEANLTDSITKIDLKKLDLETDSGVAAEIGPLKYISRLTGKSMDVVVNWFIIALMLVFDPLAVSLVIGANIVFKDKNKEKESLELSKTIDEKIESFKKKEEELNKIADSFEKRVDEISDMENKSLDRIKKAESDLNVEKEKINKEQLRISEEEEKLKLDMMKLKSEIEEESLKVTSESKERLEKLKKIEEELNNEKDALESEKLEFSGEMGKIKSESSKFEDMKKELLEKEESLKEREEDISKIDSEIKNWESLHWKMRRRPPPSAIV